LRRSPLVFATNRGYLLVAPPVLPPVEPPVLGAGAVGDFGAGALPDELPIEPDELPDGLLLEPDGLLLLPPALGLVLLKWASHSVREIVPSLLESTDEKLGWDALGVAALGDVVLDEPPAAPFALSASAAMANDESANSAAAVVMVTVFSIWFSSRGWGKRKAPTIPQAACRAVG
jgi:hypothetical protein